MLLNRKFVSKSNFVLRKVLNTETSLDILKNFIEGILNIKIKDIKLNPYLEKKAKYLPQEDNFGIVDVRIKTSENEEMNIGIQFIDGIYVHTKMLIYYAQIHLNQLEYDEKRELARTITINLLDFIYFPSSKYEQIVKLNKNNRFVKNEELELVVIELPKFNEKNILECNTKEEWITYLKGNNNKLIEKIKNQNKYIKNLDYLLEKYWKEEKME